MKLAVFSDIHGNFEAFKAVLADLETREYDGAVCLGDCIGYGPQPEEVMQEIRRRRIDTVIGNHEMAVYDPSHLNWFNPLARSSIEKTLTLLSPESLTFIRQLPFYRIIQDSRCVHGYPPDSARTYLFQKTTFDLAATFNAMNERICFVGHTHELEIVRFDGVEVKRGSLGKGVTRLNPKHHHIINVGSVGQPRDGNNQAKYVIFDFFANEVDVRFVPYDIAATVERIKAIGLPVQHANRLW